MDNQRILLVLQGLVQNAQEPRWHPPEGERARLHRLISSFWENKEFGVEERLFLSFRYVDEVLTRGQELSYHEKWDTALILKASGCYESALKIYEHLSEQTDEPCRLENFVFECLIGVGRHDRALEIARRWASPQFGFGTLAGTAFLAGDIGAAIAHLANDDYQSPENWNGRHLETKSRGSKVECELEITLCLLAAATGEGTTLKEQAERVLQCMGAPERFLADELYRARYDSTHLTEKATKLATPPHVRAAGPQREVADTLAGAETQRVQDLLSTALNFDEHVQRARSALKEFLDTGNNRCLKAYTTIVLGSGTDSMSRALVNASSGTPESGSIRLPPVVLEQPEIPSDRLLRLYDNVALLREHPNRGRLQVLLDSEGRVDALSISRLIKLHPYIEEDLRRQRKLRDARRILVASGSPGGGKRGVNADILRRQEDWPQPMLENWLVGSGRIQADSFLATWRAGLVQDLTTIFGITVLPKGSPENSVEFLALAESAMMFLNREWNRTMRKVRWKSQEACGIHLDKVWSPLRVLREYAADWLGGLRYDFYIPQEKVAIEYHGAQHFEAVEIFGGEAGLAETRRRDQRKITLSACAGVLLVIIRHDEDMTAAVQAAFAESREHCQSGN